ncbi:MAG: SDR family oxidoreductase [Terracidiphilus sp.]|jgi:nucleoside-diphosphate-sugar epimerase
MRVFVTGATGFVGSAVVRELLDAGHKVLGMARSDAGASLLTAAGAEVHRGELEDLESLRSGAAGADAVIHLGFVHDFSKFKEVCEIDRRAIEALGGALAGSDRTLIVTGGLALLVQGRAATEDDSPPAVSDSYPRASEQTAALFEQRGVRAMTVRLSQVHDTMKQGLVTYSIQVAREKGISAYIGEGQNRWAAVHRLDAARLYRLALEKGEGGARCHAIAEEGVSAREIAEAIGRRLGVPAISISPERAPGHFGWLAAFASLDIEGSSTKTREQLGWNPTGPGLISDLENMR